MMKKLVSVLLVAAMTLSFAACGGSAAPADSAAPAEDGAPAAEAPAAGGDEVYTISIQFSFPEASADGANAVLDAIEAESNGRIKFEKYYSYSYVETGDIIDALQTGLLDIAGFMPNDFGIFPLNGRLSALPLYNYPSWEAACKIYTSMVYNTPEMLAEFTDNGLVFWAGYQAPGYQIYSTKEITDLTPGVFKGLTVMCDNSDMKSFIDGNGGGSQTCFPTDFLTNLQNGVCDALVQHVNCAYVFGCFEYTKSALFFGDGGFYNFALDYAISEQTWNKLPEDLQQIFKNHAQDLCQKSYESDTVLYDNVAYPALEEGTTITVLNDAQIAEWQEAFAPTIETALDDISKDSASARDVYAKYKEMIANYDEATFDIGTNNFGLDANWK